MNIIEEQRKQIISDNNTAQNVIDGLIENINKLETDFLVQQELNGDIDLDGLSSLKIKKISFKPGNITSLKNIPASVVDIAIGNNLLTSLNELPKNLTSLDINHNYIETLDLSELKLLEQLNISHNLFTKLDYLPPLIKTFNCSNNKITYLDLHNVKKLEDLNISYNSITVIDNYPDSIVNFISEHNSSIEYRNTTSIPTEKREKQEKYDYNTCLNEYFRLRKHYEMSVFSHKLKMFKKMKRKEMSKKEFYLKTKSLVGNCVKCERNVGITFIENSEMYKATCGSNTDPCGLNIELIKGDYTTIREILDVFKSEALDVKKKIMQHKMDILFDYIDEQTGVKEYEQYIEDFEEYTNEYVNYLNKYNAIVDNTEKSAMINKYLVEVHELTQEFNVYLQKYSQTNNREFLINAMKMYTEQIYVLHKKIYNMENEIIEVIEDVNPIRHILNTSKNSLSNLETYIFQKNSVKTYNV